MTSLQRLLAAAQAEFSEVVVIGSLYSMTFEYADDTFSEHLGYEPGELVGVPVGKVLGLDKEAVTALSVHFASAQQLSDTQSLIGKDGREVRVHATVNAFTFEGEEYMVITAITYQD